MACSTERLLSPMCYIQHIAIELQNEDISKLTETRTNRGSRRNVELLPTIKKNSANNKV